MVPRPPADREQLSRGPCFGSHGYPTVTSLANSGIVHHHPKCLDPLQPLSTPEQPSSQLEEWGLRLNHLRCVHFKNQDSKIKPPNIASTSFEERILFKQPFPYLFTNCFNSLSQAYKSLHDQLALLGLEQKYITPVSPAEVCHSPKRKHSPCCTSWWRSSWDSNTMLYRVLSS